MSRYVVKSMYLEKPKYLIIWNGESIINNFIVHLNLLSCSAAVESTCDREVGRWVG